MKDTRIAMTSLTTTIAHHKARVAALSRDRAPDDPEYLAARRDLAFTNLEQRIRTTIAAAPPFTDAQREHLAAVIRGNAVASAGVA